MKVSATILAAGGSKRMGNDNKLLLLVNEKPIIYKVCNVVLESNFNQVILVTGYQSHKLVKVLPKGIKNIVYNENWEDGMMSSINIGMSKLDDEIDGNMIILGDMPLIQTSTINKLIDQFKKYDGNHVIYPLYNGKQANPVLFPKKYFSKILNSTGEKGCKKVLEKYPEDAVGIQCNSDEVIVDCDNRDDYFSIKKKLLNNVQT
tara:strand:+ start:1060 stop:1671 length:612 start_codon:yes stop_codon:yes gene_type:complete